MKGFLTALAATSLLAFGSASASSLNWFKFTDTASDTDTFSSFTVSGSFLPFTVQWWQNEDVALDKGTLPSSPSSGLTTVGLEVSSAAFFGGQVTLGDVVYNASDDGVKWVPNAGTLTGGASRLPGGYFSLGLELFGNPIPLLNITRFDADARRYDLTFGITGGTSTYEQVVSINNVSQVPIPAAALLFLSGIGGLLLIARRNSTRNKQKHLAAQPLLA